MARQERIVHRCGIGASRGVVDADPITTEIVRHSLNSIANQMKRALVRTAFSPVIYEVLDFAVAIYDRDARLLAQAPSMPVFMGTMSFCVEAAVAAAGGEEALEAGDVLLYTWPYGSGSHAQDAAVVMPVFLDEKQLIGYTTIKGHWLDIGAKDPYCTDTVDVFQEGKVYPGVKLYRRGERVEDIYRTVLANCRVPKSVAGDILAEVTGVRLGAEGLIALIQHFGHGAFMNSVERMFDYGESVVRAYFERIPDGRYVGRGTMDSNGVDDQPIPFEIAVEVDGSTVRLDYGAVPDSQAGPVNSPLPGTVSASRTAISVLAGQGEAPNEGHFRPIEVITRPGSMFHPLPPAPCYLGGWPAIQAVEVVYNAFSKVIPEAVPASSNGDVCGLIWWGVREGTGEPWADGSPHPGGQGAHRGSDGGNSLMHIIQTATRFSPAEVWEAKFPWLLERIELAQDSCGPGTHRGGLGVEMYFHMLEDSYVTCAVERTSNPPWGIAEGGSARSNVVVRRLPDGTSTRHGKVTRLELPKGTTLELHTGGGGGYGPPNRRDRDAVLADLADGYITEGHAKTHYPHAFEPTRARHAAE